MDEFEVLSCQQMSLEAELHELWNNDRSLIESKGNEMSRLLSELEDIEEEKAAIEKHVAEIDAKREVLLTGIRNKDEKLKKLLNKKQRLEKFIEEKVSKNWEARYHLERALEEIKTKMEDLSKVESVQQPESPNLKLILLESIESKIEAKEKELECPVCLDVASSSLAFLSLFTEFAFRLPLPPSSAAMSSTSSAASVDQK